MAGQSISKGALVLTTDAAQLQAGLSKVQSQISSFSNRVTGLLGGMLGIGALDGMVSKVKEIGDESENMLNLADVFEVNVEKMQALAMAANLAGIETESLVKALRIASEKFPGNDPISSLFQAMDQLRNISNVQERIKAASELFGGKNAVEVLKIMKADLPGVAAELEKSAVMTERQLKAMDRLGDSVSLFLTKTKNVFKRGMANTFLDIFGEDGGATPVDQLPAKIAETWKQIDSLQQAIDSGEHAMFVAGFSNEVTRLKTEVRALENQLTQAQMEKAVAPLRELDNVAKAAERFNDAMFKEGAHNRFEAAKKFLDFSTPIDQATLALEHFLGLFDAGLLLPQEFDMAVANLSKEFDKLNEKAETQLAPAAFRGSVEDVSASIRASVGKDESNGRIVQDLLRRLIENTAPMKNIGVVN